MAMNCDQIIDLLVDYIDGDLGQTKTRRLEEHLDCCPRCVEFIESYRETGHVCRRALRVEMPRELETSLFDFLRAELRSPQH